MAGSDTKDRRPGRSIEEIVERFDTHDMGDEWDQLPEASFDVHIQRRTHLFALDEDLAAKVSQIADERHVSSEDLIASWVREKVAETAA